MGLSTGVWRKRKALEKQEQAKKLKKSIRVTIIWLIVLAFVAVGASYAWFSLSGRASTNITPMGGTVSEGDTVLLISQSAAGPFDKTCQLNLVGNPEQLMPLSTADLEHFYRSTAQNKDGFSVLYANADDKVDAQALHGTVYLQCLNAPCDVYFNREELRLGSDAQVLASMRLGMKITSVSGTQTFIFKLDDLGGSGNVQSVQTVPYANTVVSGISGSGGQPEYSKDPAQSLSAYMAAGNNGGAYQAGSQKLAHLQANEVAAVEYWLYLEGCDEQCSNPVQNRSAELQLAFAGVDADQ